MFDKFFQTNVRDPYVCIHHTDEIIHENASN